MTTRIQYRRDTAANWAATNPVLAVGEPGYETGTDKFKVGDGVTAWSGLPYHSDDAANSATYARKVGVNIADYTDLKAAIAALPSTGGTVYVPVGRFPAGNWTYDTDYMAKANVRIVGEKCPYLSPNADRLIGGSVIYGRFNVFADGLDVSEFGVDMGKYVIDTYYGGVDTHTANHPLGGTWDAFAFAQPNMTTPLPGRRGVKIKNIIGLVRDPQTVGHAALMEGIGSGDAVGVTGVCGVHAVVIKSENIRANRLAGWCASNNGVIVKADSYAPCGNVAIGVVESRTVPPNVTPWFTPVVAANGLLFNPASASFSGPVQIGTLKVMGATTGWGITGGATYTVTDVQIDKIIADGTTGTMVSGIDFNTCRASRVQVGKLIVNNAQQGMAWAAATAGDNGQHQIHIGSAQFTNLSARAINASAYGRIRIDSLAVSGAPYAYYCEDNARIIIGHPNLMNVTNKWERNAPALAAGWTNFGAGNSTVDVSLEDYGVRVKGLALKGSGATGTMISLPIYLRPPENMRKIGMKNVSGGNQPAYIGVDSGAAGVVIDDGTAPIDGSYVSIDGIGWQHW